MKKLLFLLLFVLTAHSVHAQTVYITKTGEKYHREDCSYLRRSSISIGLAEARARGYEPCKVCKPETQTTRSATRTAPSTSEETAGSATSPSTRSAAVQCSGTTKKGTRCKRMTTNASGRCYQH